MKFGLSKNLSGSLWALLALLSIGQCCCLFGSSAGKAVSLKGTDYVRTTLWGPEIFSNEDFTFELWFNAAGPGVLVNEVDTADVFRWDYSFAEVLPGGGIVAGVPEVPAISVGIIQFGTWHHLALVYNQNSLLLSIYLDGQLAGTSSGNRKHPSEAQRTVVYAFGRGGPTNLGGGSFFKGLMDEVRIWNRPLSNSEISANYNRIIPGDSSGLYGYWNFDSGSSNLSPDSSTKKNSAMYVPVNALIPLTDSTVPLVFSTPIVQTIGSVMDENLSVRLRGLANPKNLPLEVYFEWGRDLSYGNVTPTQTLPANNQDQEFSATLSSLPAGTYHFRAVAKTGSSFSFGQDQTFAIPGDSKYTIVLNGSEYFRTTLWSHQLFQGEAFSFELWFKAAGPGVLINEADTADVRVWDKSFAEVLPNGVLKAGVPGVAAITVGTIEFNTWHHIAITYNPEIKVFAAYLDGKPAGTSVGDRMHPSEPSRTAVYAFGRGGAVNLGGGNFLSGQMDEVRIWKRVLTAEEVAATYDKITDIEQAGLVANWHMDLAEGNLIPDASKSQNPALCVPESRPPQLAVSGAPAVIDRRPVIVESKHVDLIISAVELRGSVNPKGMATSVYFEFGEQNFSLKTPVQAIGSATVPILFQSVVEGLTAGATYKYRLVASNSFGKISGPETTFVKGNWGGRSMQFRPNQYVRNIATMDSFFPDETITIEFWFYPAKVGVLASETDFQNSTQLDRSLMEILPSGSIEAGFNGLTPFNLGRAEFDHWNHLALVYDKQSQTMVGFLNGVKTMPISGDRVLPREIGRQAFYAFGKGTRTRLGTGEYFAGYIDEVRIWNVARTEQEILAKQNVPISGSETGLVLYWNFNNDPENTVVDSSGKGNHGQYFGATYSLSTPPVGFPIVPIQRFTSSKLQLNSPGLPGSFYVLEATEDFISWSQLRTNPAVSPGIVSFEADIETKNARFFRIIPQSH